MRSQKDASGPSRDGVSKRSGRSLSTCERESHECGGGAAYSVDTYVSSKILSKLKNLATLEPTILMGVAPACQRTCAYATFGAFIRTSARAQVMRYGIWSPPKVFHTCAKTCGKWCSSSYALQKEPCLWTYFEGEGSTSTI